MIIGNPKWSDQKNNSASGHFFWLQKLDMRSKLQKKNSSTLPFLKDFKIIHDYSIAYPWIVILFWKKGHLYDLSRVLQIYIRIIT